MLLNRTTYFIKERVGFVKLIDTYFKFIGSNGQELGTVTKKWAGIGKELLTSADNYIIALNETAAGQAVASALLLAAGLAIDIVFKQRE